MKTSPEVSVRFAVMITFAFMALPTFSSISPSFTMATVSLLGYLMTGWKDGRWGFKVSTSGRDALATFFVVRTQPANTPLCRSDNTTSTNVIIAFAGMDGALYPSNCFEGYVVSEQYCSKGNACPVDFMVRSGQLIYVISEPRHDDRSSFRY